MVKSKKPYTKIYSEIRRNRDDKGRILTYSVKKNGRWMEFNTLKEARVFATIGFKNKRTGRIEYFH